MRFVTAIITFVVTVSVGFNCSAQSPNLNDAKMIAAGRRLFQEKQCAYCHGIDGNGGVKLAGRDDIDPNDAFQAINEGRVQGALRMPSWRDVLTEEQIWQATAYVMSLTATPKR
jgi:mono/diheme cytochrome c family protein